MKKFILALFAFIYLSTTVGVMVNLHYCMGKLISLNLRSKESDKCDKRGMSESDRKNKGCCKDEHKFFQNSTDQKCLNAGIELTQQFGVTSPASFAEISSVLFSFVTEENPKIHAPPHFFGVAVFIRNCSFLI